jgi:MFS family permease
MERKIQDPKNVLDKENEEKLTFSIIFSALIAALGGFLFGYNTSVISGALLFLSKEFALQPEKEGVLVSIILLGALLGSCTGGVITDRLGRRKTLILTGITYCIGTMGVALSKDVGMLLIGRFITGIGVGLGSMAVPLYLAETAPTRWRGALVSLNQLMITVGILAAYLINYAFSSSGNWRWMFGLAIIPTLFQIAGMCYLPESIHFSQEERKIRGKLSTIMRALVIGILLSAFQQITGINAVIYYASKIFQMAGYTNASSATFVTIGIGIINVIATLLSVWLLDRKGRRWLLLLGIAGMALSLGLISTAFMTEWEAVDILAPISLMAYVAFFAIGLGPVPWVILSEIYPLSLRGRAMGVATFANWLCNYLVALTFLDLVSGIGSGGAFAIYAFLSVIAFFFVLRFIPETKGKTLEEIQQSLYTDPRERR